MARTAIYKHNTLVDATQYPDDPSAPIGTNEWNEDPNPIGMLGFTGGKLGSICDLFIHVKAEAGEYGPVEDAHLIINHILAHWFQNQLK